MRVTVVRARTAVSIAHSLVGQFVLDPTVRSVRAVGYLRVRSFVALSVTFTKSGHLFLAYNSDTAYVVKQVTSAWDNVRAGMKRLFPASSPRTFDAVQIFLPDASAPDVVKLLVTPVIFNLPERAGRQAGANLYIVVSGWLSFEK